MTYRVHTLRRFDSVGEVVSYAQAGSDPRGSSHERGSGFAGTDSFDDACQLALDGWQGVREQVDSLSTSLIAQLRETMRTGIEYHLSYAGSAVNMGRYMMGDPRCMQRGRFVEEPGHAKVVRILISCTCSGSISTETIIQRGIAVTALVELLGHANKAVEIYVEDSVSDNQDIHVTLTRVKDANEPMDINRVMFAMGHPAWQRRIMFAAQECEDMAIRRKFGFVKMGGYAGRGYGQWVGTGALIMGEELGEDTVLLGALNYGQRWDPKSSVDWIISTLRNCGVEVEEES